MLFLIISLGYVHKVKSRNQVDSLINASSAEINAQNFSQALKLLNSAKLLANEKNDLNALSDIYFNIGLTQYYLTSFNHSIDAYQSAIELYAFLNDSNSVSQCHWMIGRVNRRRGLFQEAISNYLEALKIAQSIKVPKLVADIQNSLGLLYKETKDYDNAIGNFKAALLYQKESNNIKLQANALNNLGLIHKELHDLLKAKEYYKKALEIKMSYGDTLQISSTILNLSELYIHSEQIDSAIIYLHQSLNMQKSNIDKSLAIAAHNLLGNAYRIQKKFPKSEFHLTEASELLKKIKSRRHSLDNFKYRKALALDLKKFEQALHWDAKYDSLSDLYFEEERLRVQQIESEYYINQEKQRNEILQVQKNQQEQLANFRLWVVVILTVILIVIVVLFFQLSKRNSKISILNSELEKRNELINVLSKNNYHFTMNVLTEMKSMFAYQSSQLSGEEKFTFNKVSSSINTTAQLFEHLLKTHDELIDKNKLQDVKPYLESVIHGSLHIYGLGDEKIETHIHIDSAIYRADQMYALGQIINELITNSGKYAFNNRDAKGRLDISFMEMDEAMQLDYKDDGPGLTESEKKDSLGMNLVQILTKSLGGTFDILTPEKGAHFKISIPISDESKA